jgi:hypothetical protein
VVTVGLDQLRTGLGDACPTETGLELSVAAVRGTPVVEEPWAAGLTGQRVAVPQLR